MLDHPHRARTQPRHERLLDRRAGGIAARVQDARVGVGRLESLDEIAVAVAVECHTEVDQLADARRALVHEHSHGLGIAQARSGDERVADVVLAAVVREHDPGDAALGVTRVGVLENVLRDQRDAASALDGVQGHRQPGDPAADDDGVERAPPSPCPERSASCPRTGRNEPPEVAEFGTWIPGSGARPGAATS